MEHLQGFILCPEIPHAYFKIRAFEGPVYAHAGISGGNGPGNGLGTVAGVLAIVEIDADAVAGELLSRVVGNVTVESRAHGAALVHGDAGAQDGHDVPSHEGGVHLRGTAVHSVFLRPEQRAREQGEDGYDQQSLHNLLIELGQVHPVEGQGRPLPSLQAHPQFHIGRQAFHGPPRRDGEQI